MPNLRKTILSVFGVITILLGWSAFSQTMSLPQTDSLSTSSLLKILLTYSAVVVGTVITLFIYFNNYQNTNHEKALENSEKAVENLNEKYINIVKKIKDEIIKTSKGNYSKLLDELKKNGRETLTTKAHLKNLESNFPELQKEISIVRSTLESLNDNVRTSDYRFEEISRTVGHLQNQIEDIKKAG